MKQHTFRDVTLEVFDLDFKPSNVYMHQTIVGLTSHLVMSHVCQPLCLHLLPIIDINYFEGGC